MKQRILILIGVFYSITTFSQYIYSDTTWERWYGYPYRWEALPPTNNPIEHYDNAYIYNFRSDFLTSPTNKPVIIKTDINGYFLWERKLDSITNIAVSTIKNYNDGGILLCGINYHSDIGNPWLAKLNTCMEVEWCKIFDWPNYSFSKDIEEDQDGNIIVLTFGYGETITDRINLIKLSPNGDVIWKQDIARIYDHHEIWDAVPQQILIGPDNYYYIAAEAWWPDAYNPNWTGIRSIFIKVSPEGNEEWLLPIGIYDSLFSRPWSLHQFTEDSFVAISENYETENPVIMFFNADGEELSLNTKQIMPETYYANRLLDPIQLSDTSYLCLWAHTYTPQDTYWHQGYIIVDTALNVIDYMEDERMVGPSSLIPTFNEKFVTVSMMVEDNNSGNPDIYLNKRDFNFDYDTVYSNWSGNYDTLCPEGIVSGYLPYTCDMIVGIEDLVSPEEYKEALEKVGIQVQPNPAHTQVSLILENTNKFKNLQMSVYNQTGEEVYVRKLHNGIQEELLNISVWNSGMYFIVVRSENRLVGVQNFWLSKVISKLKSNFNIHKKTRQKNIAGLLIFVG